MGSVLIYNDAGASKDCVTALSDYFETNQCVANTVLGSELQKTAWLSKTSVLIIPGGRSLPYYDSLGDNGNQHIIDFVTAGGTYIGICAGAYYACQQTIFAKGLAKELTLPGALNFFSGQAIGPVFAAKSFEYQSEQGACVVEIHIKEKSYPVYFNGGCYFNVTDDLLAQPNIHVLARYEANNKPAIISCAIGKGRVLLSGVHPELSYRSIDNTQDPHHQKLRHTLEKNEDQRQELMNLLFKSILLTTDKLKS